MVTTDANSARVSPRERQKTIETHRIQEKVMNAASINTMGSPLQQTAASISANIFTMQSPSSPGH